VPVRCQLTGEGVEEHIHRARIRPRQSQGERLVSAGPGGGEQGKALVGLIDNCGRAHASLVPDPGGAPLSHRYGPPPRPRAGGAGRDAQLQGPAASGPVALLNAAGAAASPFGWDGRVFWRERSRRSSRQDRPHTAGAQRRSCARRAHTRSTRGQALPSSRSGLGRRSISALRAACCPSLSRSGRPGRGLS
jgi:hypothetical protein